MHLQLIGLCFCLAIASTCHAQAAKPTDETAPVMAIDVCDLLKSLEPHHQTTLSISGFLELSYQHGLSLSSPKCKTPIVLKGQGWQPGLELALAGEGNKERDKSVSDFALALNHMRSLLGPFRLVSLVTVRGRLDLEPLHRARPGENLDLGSYPGRLLVVSIRGR